jgi:hypothetical protein
VRTSSASSSRRFNSPRSGAQQETASSSRVCRPSFIQSNTMDVAAYPVTNRRGFWSAAASSTRASLCVQGTPAAAVAAYLRSPKFAPAQSCSSSSTSASARPRGTLRLGRHRRRTCATSSSRPASKAPPLSAWRSPCCTPSRSTAYRRMHWHASKRSVGLSASSCSARLLTLWSVRAARRREICIGMLKRRQRSGTA